MLQEPGLEALKRGGGAAVSATSPASELLVLLSILNSPCNTSSELCLLLSQGSLQPEALHGMPLYPLVFGM